MWTVTIAIRVVAAMILTFGPATDSARELRGWDATRFQEIASIPGRPWVDSPVEYPPGSVSIIEVLAAGTDPVGTNRRLVAASLAIDLGAAAFLRRRVASEAGLAYLGLGTLMVPMGLLRLDLWAAFAATIGLVELERQRAGRFAIAMTAGWLIKVFPALLVPVAFATRSWRSAAVGIGVSLAAAAAWIAYGGFGAVEQVMSLRNVTGWHLESVAGSITALTTGEVPRLEADAYRIGTIDGRVVLALRLALVGLVAGLGWLTARVAAPATPSDSTLQARLEPAALMMLGSLAGLLLTAPLLSPQFLLWLSPFGALLVRGPNDLRRPEIVTLAAAMALTSVTLGIFGPPGLGSSLAAGMLLVRDALLVGVSVACAWRLRTLGLDRSEALPAATS
jgi:hypothetical protein